ncbi:DHA1 family inner membrane transport protein [Frigoribacterium sp. PhB160]|uniref:MFS transporter n=1 Tax=Frigoribacterium sp. PhB160 TaxID=2485192 RepID=UPI000F9FAA33|nr:MFS transporter [Frigoribacterium sp. PhB160]ROS61989.1 DHA1 family inner membrane transport protein [Frigoribacterium sp. PhB160]
MITLSPRRRTAALIALALGGFGIGSTEFVAMGLLPNIASDLLPGLYSASTEEGIARAGWLVSAYALGVVVGAPTIAAMSSHLPKKKLLMGLLALFVVGTVLSAVLPSFGWVLAARFFAGLPHGAYFGIASIVAATIMGPGNRGKGVALVLSGLTIANVVGVPTITWLGQTQGWRVAYLAVAAIFALTFVAVGLAVPRLEGDSSASMRRELRAFRQPQVWLVMGIGAIGFGGFFAVYSYIANAVTEGAGQSEGVVPWVLVTVGVGMTIGNVLGGWLADRDLKLALFFGFGGLIVALSAYALTVDSIVGIFACTFLVGLVGSAIGPSVQSRLMEVAGESQVIGAALNHSAMNLGNSAGAYLGGAVIAAGFGFAAPGWVGVVLAVAGVVLTIVSFALQRSGDRRQAEACAAAEDADRKEDTDTGSLFVVAGR